MSEQHSYRATILPVPESIPRPIWSVMIPTYNCAGYLREALTSVLAQDLGPDVMQIEVVDDHSTRDDPAAVVEDLGHGRVGFYRQTANVGYIRNFETCLKRARGKLIHLLHGDDCVRDGFYRQMQKAFDEYPEIGAAFCRHIFMDEHGHWRLISQVVQPESGVLSNGLEQIVVKQHIQTPSIVVRRKVYEKLGGFDRRLSCCGEDWEMRVRIAAHYPVWYEVEPLAVYRLHSASLNGRAMRAGENIRDLRRALSIMKQHLPDNCKNELSKMALKQYAFYALESAGSLAATGDTRAAMIQIREALLCISSLNILRLSFKLTARVFYRMMISSLRWAK